MRRAFLYCFTRTGVGYDARNTGRWVQMFAS